jgi:hypothetical protein
MVQSLLTAVHEALGQFLTWVARLLTLCLLSGALFLFGSVNLSAFLKAPEVTLQLEGAQLNVLELSPVADKRQDPDWDGAVAGFCLGLGYGQSNLLIGPVVGPAIGAFVGYQLDSRF